MKGTAEVSPSLKARITGALYFLSLLTGLFADYFFHDKAYTAGLLEISGMIAVTLLLYAIFRPVNKSLALLAASLNLVAMIFEAQRVNPQGQGVGLVIHGLGWLTYLSTPFQNYNLGICLFGEGSVMLWLLVMGVNDQRWKERANAAGASTRT